MASKIMPRLKQETEGYYSKLESLPYFEALREHKLPLECYVNQLRALSIIHGVLENEIRSSDDKLLEAVWDNDLRKLPLLEADLAVFKPSSMYSANNSIDIAIAMTQKIRLRRVEKPFTLLGYLYVLERFIFNSSIYKADILSTFHLDGYDGCRYYTGYGDQAREHWSEFCEKMDSALDDSSLHGEILEAAHMAFAGLEMLYSSLYPADKP
jgi:heme oxygenase